MPMEPPSGLTVPPRQAMPMHFIVMLDTTITVIAAVTSNELHKPAGEVDAGHGSDAAESGSHPDHVMPDGGHSYGGH